MILLLVPIAASLAIAPKSTGNDHNVTYGHHFKSQNTRASVPFRLSYTNWWTCNQKSLLRCYAQLVEEIHYNLNSERCSNTSNLMTMASTYQKNLQETIDQSTDKKNSQCEEPKWTEAMTVVANIVLQYSERCKLDYVALFSLTSSVAQNIARHHSCLNKSTNHGGFSSYHNYTTEDRLYDLLNAQDGSASRGNELNNIKKINISNK